MRLWSDSLWIEGKPVMVLYCHCRDCQRSGGGTTWNS